MVTVATLVLNFLPEMPWAVRGLRLGWGLNCMGLESTGVSGHRDDITLMPSRKPQGSALSRDCHR